MLELNKSNFEKEIKGNKLMVVDLWAEWCGPCKAMNPVLEELNKEMKNITFAKMNVDENSDIASSLGVMSIPTFLIYKNGFCRQLLEKSVLFLHQKQYLRAPYCLFVSQAAVK